MEFRFMNFAVDEKDGQKEEGSWRHKTWPAAGPTDKQGMDAATWPAGAYDETDGAASLEYTGYSPTS